MYTAAEGSAQYASNYLPRPMEMAHRSLLQQPERQTPVLDIEVEALASSVYREMEAKNQLFILDQEFEKRYRAELGLPAVSEKHWKIAKYHFRTMARHKGDPVQVPQHHMTAGSLNGTRPSHGTSEDSPVHQPAVQHIVRADSGEVSGRFSIPAVRPSMKHSNKTNNKAMMTFLSMVQDASPNDPPPPPKPPMHGPLPIMADVLPEQSAPRPTPRAATPPAPETHTSLAALNDVVMPLVQSMATLAYEVQQERCALQQERSCVRVLLEELRQERVEHRQLLLGVLQAFRAANAGAVKIVQDDVHRSAAVALLLAASMRQRPQ